MAGGWRSARILTRYAEHTRRRPAALKEGRYSGKMKAVRRMFPGGRPEGRRAADAGVRLGRAVRRIQGEGEESQMTLDFLEEFEFFAGPGNVVNPAAPAGLEEAV